MSTRLDTLDDRPELTVRIAGREWSFSELTLEKRADLQAYLRRAVPHPVDAVKGHIDGLTPEERRPFLEAAREAAREWPPDIGRPDGMQALMSTEEGRAELLAAALSLHHPELPREAVGLLYRELNRMTRREEAEARRRGEPFDGGTARRVFMVAMGAGDPAVEEPLPLPEGSGPDRTASIGATSIAPATSGSSWTNGRSAATP
jgi:hypothetical protein